MLQDLRYAVRMLLKAPGFTVVAVITLALGIGANTAVSSYVIAWTLRPLPYPESDRLVLVQRQNPREGWMVRFISAADFYDWQRESRVFQQLAAWNPAPFNLTTDGPPLRVAGARVTWNFFHTLGVAPSAGRLFTTQDDQPGAGSVAILSRGFWQARFGGDPNIIGRKVLMDEKQYTVIGVMPGDFQFPLLGTVNVWTPLALSDTQRSDRKIRMLQVVGRLEPGTTLAQATVDMNALSAQLAKDYPATNAKTGVQLNDLQHAIGDNAGTQQAVVVFWIVWLVLLIACANVANLMLARASHRTRELAVRAAIGAGRWRLMRQLLTEAVVLFLAGGAAGILTARFGLDWLDSLIPENLRGEMPNFGHVSLDWDIFLYTLAASVLCGVVFGFAPALLSSRVDVNMALKDASAQTSASARRGRLRNIFVAGEIALALIVVVCSALLIETFIHLIPTNTGFEHHNLMVASIDLPQQKYRDSQQVRDFYDQVLKRVQALPQVTAAGESQSAPFLGTWWLGLEVVGHPVPSGERQPFAAYSAVSPEYFAAMHIPMLRGRVFSVHDDAGAPPVMIVDEEMARRYWPDGNALGSQVRIAEKRLGNPLCTVVGIVRNVRLFRRAGERPDPEMYVPFAQFPNRSTSLVVRSTGDPVVVADAIRNSVWAQDRYQPLTLVRPMGDIIQEANGPWQAMAQVVGFFSMLALLLAAVGIYGVTSYTVTQRSHEIGIRMALGASGRDVLQLVLGHGMRLAAIGIALGVIGALGAARFLAFMLYGVSASHPPTFITTALLLGAVAALASYIPARRATRVDPMVALRYE